MKDRRDLNLRPSEFGDQIIDPDPEAENWGGGEPDAGYRTFAQHPEIEDPYGHYGTRARAMRAAIGRH
jgi:hypothetical protein